MDLSLKGKTALVCGSTQGIGLATAVELALLGATCVLLARNEDRLKAVLPTLATAERQQHRYEVADFSEIAQVTAVAAKLAASGPVHILINNTGGPPGGPLIEANITAFTAAFSQHLLCNQVLTQALVPGMIQSRFGRIINIISTSVKTPIKNLGVSNTTRWAVAAWSKTLATELAPHGITVNNVLPGSTSTARLEGLFNSSAAARNVSREVVEAEWLKEIPMQRFGEAKEIAALAAFLASPAAGYITGTSTAVDGGKTPVM
ncbi:3-oxoacyl-[acyl-carrier protein] reductase [Chitinophaga polysaccharea]|uniref:3-oxoacyl-[acyl-carrier protein] reductase n=1 Tax=Chitinophaga polysaccharea TaxID=1293035 RepID=A0A561P693_9BACT|nr:SDR family oxidoreductase [Chitinophaga polysaccharea]TWF33638.1 3-oxoacyl-[acyl-carrier protein] reductase [Chitinophaga polysaccharea]